MSQHQYSEQPSAKPHIYKGLQAILFDFDGTILDTETREFWHWQDLYRQHDLELSLEDWQQGIGTWDAFDPWEQLPPEVKAARESVAAELHTRIVDDIAQQDLRAGVRHVLEQVAGLGLRLALVTSSNRDWVMRWLEQHELLELFELLVTRDDVRRVKPDPELYVEAALRLGLRAEECLAIEDSLNGATAALAAGARVVVVPNDVTRSQPFPSTWPQVPDFGEGLESLIAAAGFELAEA